MRRPRARTCRPDANQAEIVSVLRKCGALVLITNELGGGVADLFVSAHGKITPLEVKSGDEAITDEQRDWLTAWGGKVVRTPNEALRAVGLLR